MLQCIKSAQTDQSSRTTAMLFSGIISVIVARFQAYRAYRLRLQTLESLDDRELDELGISRCDIDQIARRA